MVAPHRAVFGVVGMLNITDELTKPVQISVGDANQFIDLVKYQQRTRHYAFTAWLLAAFNACCLIVLLASGCSLHTRPLEDGRLSVDWRVGLEGYSLAHGKLVADRVDVDVDSDCGRWCVEAAISSIGGVGSLVKDGVGAAVGLFR